MNVDKYTPFKDFGFYLIVALLLLLTSYITLFPYLLQYEESNHPSKRAILSNSIFEIVFFSYNFLEKITIYDLPLAFITSLFSIATLLSILANLIKYVYHKNN